MKKRSLKPDWQIALLGFKLTGTLRSIAQLSRHRVWLLVSLMLFSACDRSEQARQIRERKLTQISEQHKDVQLAEEHLKVKLYEPVPELHGPDSSGKRFSLAEYQGKVTLVYYWAHW